MKNIKYLYCKETNDNITELYFKIHHNIAEVIRKYTNYSEDILEIYLSKDDVFVYRIARSDKSEAVRDSVIETIEKISNEGDDKRFYNHILTDNGKHKNPRKFHTQMENEYGLKNDVEWWVAHFFIGLSDVLFSPDDEYE
ncbi:MAG: hypothetical protein U0K87_13735 [Ruminococcus sp.]|nr:hypothetical protein [Ruminococcus sp.]